MMIESITMGAIPFDGSLFMPRHRGPIILILGGSVMLAFTLFVSLMLQGRHRATPAGTPARTTRHRYPHHSSMDRATRVAAAPVRQTVTAQKTAQKRDPLEPGGAGVRRSWLRAMARTARRNGLGPCQRMVAPGGRHALQLGRCHSGAQAMSGSGCERERRLLEAGVRRRAPHARVREASCGKDSGRGCTFEIVMGGPS